MGLKVIGWDNVDSTHLAQDRDQWRVLLSIVTDHWVL
jgi:hypothetical protein